MSGRIAWLASYPKSGNTWFRAVAVAWRTGHSVDLNQLSAPGIATIASARPRLEAALGIPTSLMTDDEIDLLRPRVDDVIAGRWGPPRSEFDDEDVAPTGEDPRTSSAGPVLVKIHDALYGGPTGEPIVSPSSTVGAICIVRDPRDVAVSYAHHYGLTHERAVAVLGDPDHVLSRSDRGISHQVRQRLGTWSEHVTSWIDHSWFPVHVVRYEDCQRDPVATFTAALRFAGFDALPDDVAVAVDRARFDRLASLEAAGGFRERPDHADRFFRKGVAGGWRTELAAELVARVEADHGAVMTRLGYTVAEATDSTDADR